MWVAAMVAVALGVAYWPIWQAGFIWDDDSLLTANPLIKSPDGLWAFWFTTKAQDYWPMVSTSFWLEWRIWGMHAAGYHATNLLLHGVSALLVWSILKQLRIPGAALAAVLFAIHPVNVESVAWIAQRKNTLSLLFFLLAVRWYLVAEEGYDPGRHRFGQPGATRWYWLSFSMFVLAMLSKGSVAMLPVLLLGLVWWRRPVVPWDWVRLAPFLAVALVLVKVNIWFQTHGMAEAVIRTAGPAERIAGAGAIVWFYLSKVLLPINLIFVYPQWHVDVADLRWWVPLAGVIAVLGLLAWRRNGWGRPYFFAFGYFCTALVPVLGFTDVYFMKFSLVADHYQHVAMIGIVALIAAGWSGWHARTSGAARLAAVAVLCAGLGTLGVLTWRQTRIYHDVFVLYETTLARNPACWMAHNNLGNALVDAGRADEAIAHFEASLKLRPDYAPGESNLGDQLTRIGRATEAIPHLERALQLEPNYPEAHNNLGVAFIATGRAAEAIAEFRAALHFKPDYAQAHFNLGLALSTGGNVAEGMPHFQEALRLKPDYAEAQMNWGVGLVMSNRLDDALPHFEAAVRLGPAMPDTHYSLGRALVRAGRVDDAIAQFREALQLNPAFADAHLNLALALRQAGRMEEATSHYNEALRLNPSLGATRP